MALEIPTWMQQNAYDARIDRLLIKSLVINEGVASPLSFKIGPKTPASMLVTAQPGFAFIDGDDVNEQGMYMVRNNGPLDIGPITAPSAGNKRIDTVCLRINDPGASGPAGNNASFFVVAGDPVAISGGTAVAKAVPSSAIPLADLALTAGMSSITSGLITNRRELCGGIDHVGTVKQYTGELTLLPKGWMLCQGQTISRSTYAELFELVGTIFGTGDGSTTFGLPDAHGKAIIGSGAGYNLGDSGGVETVTIDVTKLPPHTHTIDHDHPSFNADTDTQGLHSHGPLGGGANFIKSSPNIDGGLSATTAGSQTAATSNDGSHHHTTAINVPALTGSSGNGGFANNPISIRNPYLIMAHIIRVS